MLRRSLLAATLALATRPPRARAQGAPVTLNVWSWQVAQAPIYRQIFSLYENANPGIRVAFRGVISTEYPTVLKTGLSGPGGPDIAMLHPYKAIAPYVRAGQLAAIDDALPERHNFTETSLAAARLDGRLWGLPFARQTIQIYYSRKLFARLGVTPPATAAAFPKLLDTIAAAGVTPLAVTGKDAWQLVNVFDALVGTVYGGRDFVTRILSGAASFTDPAMVRALEAFQGYAKYFPRFVSAVSMADSRAMFAAGRAAMFPGGSWELSGLQRAGMDGDIGVFSIPDHTGGPAPTWGYEDGSLGVSAASPHPKEAMALLRWMATPEFGQAFTDQLKQPSSVNGVTPHDPVLAQMVTNFTANPVPMMWVTDYFGVSSPAPYAALMNEAQKLLAGATTAQQAAAAIAQSVVEWNAQTR
jgi:raffinose/stachyose/melibiose transport system substrate-binding protein